MGHPKATAASQRDGEEGERGNGGGLLVSWGMGMGWGAGVMQGWRLHRGVDTHLSPPGTAG